MQNNFNNKSDAGEVNLQGLDSDLVRNLAIAIKVRDNIQMQQPKNVCKIVGYYCSVNADRDEIIHFDIKFVSLILHCFLDFKFSL